MYLCRHWHVVLDVVLDGVDHAERHHQTDRHQTDVDAQADELFDAVRFQRVPLPPLAIRGRSMVASSRQTDQHHDAADNQRPERQKLGDGLLKRRPDRFLEEDALTQLVLRERAVHPSRRARIGPRHAIKRPEVMDVDANEYRSEQHDDCLGVGQRTPAWNAAVYTPHKRFCSCHFSLFCFYFDVCQTEPVFRQL